MGVEIPPTEQVKISIAKLPTTGHELFGRKEELKKLDKAWDDEHTNILSLVAWGGVGKTTLVNHWLGYVGGDNWRGAERVYGWSFYSQGTREGRQVSGDEFLAYTLKWFGDPNPKKGSPWGKGIHLAELIRRQKTLLILDGLEPLQYPPGHMQGQLKDQGLQALLKELARFNPGLCIITTREKVENLEHVSEPALRRIFLENLSDEEGMQLLKSLGVKGIDEELKVAVGEFGGHALALNLLGSYLATVHEGEIRKRDLVPRLTNEEEQGGHAKRVMESYEIWLKGKPELDILYMMGLFDRPAQGGAIEVIRTEPVIEGLTDKLQNLSEAEWKFALKRLRDLMMLGERDENEPDKLDCHPLIREYFGEKLRRFNGFSLRQPQRKLYEYLRLLFGRPSQVWREAHGRLYEYYRDLPEKKLPDTLEEMEPLFAAVSHGCQAGRQEEALFDVQLRRIHRKPHHYIIHTLGAIGADLATWGNFFEEPRKRLASGLSDRGEAIVWGQTGYDLRALGRLSEAAHCFEEALAIATKSGNWLLAAIRAGHLARLHLLFGKLQRSESYGEDGLKYISKVSVDLKPIVESGTEPPARDVTPEELREFNHAIILVTLGETLFNAGKTKKAKERFEEAERIQKQLDFGSRSQLNPRFSRYGHFLLEQGRCKEARLLAEKARKIVNKMPAPNLVRMAAYNMLMARALMLEGDTWCEGFFKLVKKHLDSAVSGMRDAARRDEIATSLLVRGSFYRKIEKLEEAKRDLDEACKIVTLCGMRLYQADCCLQYARLCLAQGGKLKEAREHLEEAAKRVVDMDYHRRDPEVLLIQAELEIVESNKKSARETLEKAKERIDEMGCHRWDVEVERIENLELKM